MALSAGRRPTLIPLMLQLIHLPVKPEAPAKIMNKSSYLHRRNKFGIIEE